MEPYKRLSRRRPKNIVFYLEERTRSNVSLNLIEQFWSDDIELFSNLEEGHNWCDHLPKESGVNLTTLTFREGLVLIKRMASHLKKVFLCQSIFAKEAYLQFGSCCVKINAIKLSKVVKIFNKSCVNMLECRIDLSDCYDLDIFSSNIVKKILCNNPMISTMWLWISCPEKRIPFNAKAPALKEIRFFGDAYGYIKGFSSIMTDSLKIIDLASYTIYEVEISELLPEILRFKNTLEVLKLNLQACSNAEFNVSKLLALGKCLSLKYISIEVCILGRPIVGNFMSYIARNCRNLEYVYLNNLTISDVTYSELRSLPNIKQLNVNHSQD